MKYLSICIIALCAVFQTAGAQDIILDKTVRAGELILFQSVSNPNEYYYLSDKARLAKHPDGKPQFLFMRYVDNQKSGGDQPDKDKGEGGGIVHCVIELGVTDDQLRNAQQALRRINSTGTIKGPAIYSGGTIALVSSVNDPASGFSKKILGLGKAPILDGQKAAISINLTQLGSKILWETFKTPTPDVSFSFEMDLEGYRAPKRAIIEANFDQIYTSQSFNAAIVSRQGAAVLAGEINVAFEELTKSGAIKVTQIGTDENMEKALEDAYSKLTRMMFEPAGSAAPQGVPGVPGANTPTMLDRAQQLLSRGRRDALEDYTLFASEDAESENGQGSTGSGGSGGNGGNGSGGSGGSGSGGEEPRSFHSPERPPSQDMTPQYRPRFNNERTPPTMPTTAIVASYSLKTVRQRGTYKIDLNKYTADNLSMRFDHNIGTINCTECFREVNLDDDLTKQREISAIMDGYNADDFQKYINFVNVQMRKKHGSGEFTNDEVNIDRTKFNQQGNYFKMLYGWKGDANRVKWKEYEYRIVWSFFGGGQIESPWTKSEFNTIPLIPPFQRKVIDIEADADNFSTSGVRSAAVKLTYKVADKVMTREVRLNPKTTQMTAQTEILLPSQNDGTASFEYEIVWTMNDGSSQTSGKKTTTNSFILANKLQ